MNGVSTCGIAFTTPQLAPLTPQKTYLRGSRSRAIPYLGYRRMSLHFRRLSEAGSMYSAFYPYREYIACLQKARNFSLLQHVHPTFIEA